MDKSIIVISDSDRSSCSSSSSSTDGDSSSEVSNQEPKIGDQLDESSTSTVDKNDRDALYGESSFMDQHLDTLEEETTNEHVVNGDKNAKLEKTRHIPFESKRAEEADSTLSSLEHTNRNEPEDSENSTSNGTDENSSDEEGSVATSLPKPMEEDVDTSDEELFPIDHVDQPNFIYQTVYSGILKAVSSKNLDKLKEMVHKGCALNINDNGGNTALHLAVACNEPEILDFLLAQSDIMVDTRNFSGATPLLCAVEQGNQLFVEKLIKAGASVYLTNFHDISPLHLSVMFPKICNILIENGADVNAQDYGGETPLHEAVDQSNWETLYMLLFYNADANVQCDNGLTPFMKAIYQKKSEMQWLLLDYVDDFNIVADDGMSLLGFAITYDSPCKSAIIERSANVNYLHPTHSIHQTFLENLSEKNFLLIWDRIRCQELNRPDFWSALCQEDIKLEFPAYLGLLVESGNIQPLLNMSRIIPSFSFLNSIKNFCISSWEDVITKLFLIFLTQGAILTSSHLCDVYRAFGHGDLFEMLLFQDFVNLPGRFGFPNLIFNFRIKPDDKFNEKIFNDESVPRHIKEKDVFLYRKYHCPKNRSLLELAKETTRDYLIQKMNIQSCREFHTYVKHLPIRQVFKDIITYKKPIYFSK